MTDIQKASKDDQLFELEQMSREKLLLEWERVNGSKPPKYTSSVFLRQALAFELQSAAHGGLPARFRRVLKQSLAGRDRVASTADVVPHPAAVLSPGIKLVREWNGKTYQVEVLGDGFRMDGKPYTSLSAIAKRITGVKWSGPRFFGLVSKAQRSNLSAELPNEVMSREAML